MDACVHLHLAVCIGNRIPLWAPRQGDSSSQGPPAISGQLQGDARRSAAPARWGWRPQLPLDCWGTRIRCRLNGEGLSLRKHGRGRGGGVLSSAKRSRDMTPHAKIMKMKKDNRLCLRLAASCSREPGELPVDAPFLLTSPHPLLVEWRDWIEDWFES